MLNIGYEIQSILPYEQALEEVKIALNNEGFGVLTFIDVRKTIREKLDGEFKPYAILGACNPPLALRALSSDPAIGLLLPCNITVEDDLKGGTIIRISNPETLLLSFEDKHNEELREVAFQAGEKIKKVVDKISGI